MQWAFSGESGTASVKASISDFVRVMEVRVDGLFVFGGEHNAVVVRGVNVV